MHTRREPCHTAPSRCRLLMQQQEAETTKRADVALLTVPGCEHRTSCSHPVILFLVEAWQRSVSSPRKWMYCRLMYPFKFQNVFCNECRCAHDEKSTSTRLKNADVCSYTCPVNTKKKPKYFLNMKKTKNPKYFLLWLRLNRPSAIFFPEQNPLPSLSFLPSAQLCRMLCAHFQLDS
jgi:hypothetical protein